MVLAAITATFRRIGAGAAGVGITNRGLGGAARVIGFITDEALRVDALRPVIGSHGAIGIHTTGAAATIGSADSRLGAAFMGRRVTLGAPARNTAFQALLATFGALGTGAAEPACVVTDRGVAIDDAARVVVGIAAHALASDALKAVASTHVALRIGIAAAASQRVGITAGCSRIRAAVIVDGIALRTGAAHALVECTGAQFALCVHRACAAGATGADGRRARFIAADMGVRHAFLAAAVDAFVLAHSARARRAFGVVGATAARQGSVADRRFAQRCTADIRARIATLAAARDTLLLHAALVGAFGRGVATAASEGHAINVIVGGVADGRLAAAATVIGRIADLAAARNAPVIVAGSAHAVRVIAAGTAGARHHITNRRIGALATAVMVARIAGCALGAHALQAAGIGGRRRALAEAVEVGAAFDAAVVDAGLAVAIRHAIGVIVVGRAAVAFFAFGRDRVAGRGVGVGDAGSGHHAGGIAGTGISRATAALAVDAAVGHAVIAGLIAGATLRRRIGGLAAAVTAQRVAVAVIIIAAFRAVAAHAERRGVGAGGFAVTQALAIHADIGVRHGLAIMQRGAEAVGATSGALTVERGRHAGVVAAQFIGATATMIAGIADRAEAVDAFIAARVEGAVRVGDAGRAGQILVDHAVAVLIDAVTIGLNTRFAGAAAAGQDTGRADRLRRERAGAHAATAVLADPDDVAFIGDAITVVVDPIAGLGRDDAGTRTPLSGAAPTLGEAEDRRAILGRDDLGLIEFEHAIGAAFVLRREPPTCRRVRAARGQEEEGRPQGGARREVECASERFSQATGFPAQRQDAHCAAGARFGNQTGVDRFAADGLIEPRSTLAFAPDHAQTGAQIDAERGHLDLRIGATHRPYHNAQSPYAAHVIPLRAIPMAPVDA